MIKIIKACVDWSVSGMLVLMTMAAVLASFSIQWMLDTWANIKMDELLYHLNAPLEGTNQDMIREYINICITPTIVIILFLIVLLVAFRKKKRRFLILLGGVLGAFLICIGMADKAWTELEGAEYVEAQKRGGDFIGVNYADPEEVKISFPEKKRNLIYIFLESMETTYADESSGGAFETNVIPELTKIAQENEDFSGESEKLNGAFPMASSTWTMAAMFAHTSGLPLRISIEGNSMDTQEVFFPGLTTLGDILEKEGYTQTLMVGSDAKFGGRELYYADHGNFEIIDYPYAMQNGMIPPGYKVWWGFEDKKLFDFAKEKLLELDNQGAPFNLTLLTVDTHFEDGWLCEECPTTFGQDQYSNVMACASKQLYEFLMWIQEQPFYEDTTIVLAGDHLTMDVDYCLEVDNGQQYERKDYVAFINSAKTVESEKKRTYTTFDLFPTTLSALGAEIEGGRLGLGTDLFSDTETLIERFGYEEFNIKLKGNSKFMEEAAQIGENSEKLLEREGKTGE